jgi:predicted HTH transcriptional regulator
MKPKELIELIALGESSRLEFKRKLSSPEKIAKEIAALANTRGGQLLIGVDDDGTIVGVRSEKSEIDIIQSACGICIEPPVRYDIDIVSIYGTDVIVADIPESKRKPHIITIDDDNNERAIKRAYIRVGEKSVMASREMFRLMKYQSDSDKKLMLSIGDKEKRLFSYIEFHGRATVSDFAKMVNISKRQAERILIKLVQAGVLQIHNDSTHDYFTMI